MRISLAAAALLVACGAATAAERFDPENMGEHVTVRTVLGHRAARGIRIDGKFNERAWLRTDPITELRARAGGSLGSLYVRRKKASGPIRIAIDPTFVRVACDKSNMYFAVVCLVAPRKKGTRLKSVERDMVLFRFDPFARGRHALEIVLNVKGRKRSYDTHENWAYGYVPPIEFSARKLEAVKPEELPPEERAALERLGEGASGWVMEAAISWRELANSRPPEEGEVWGLQVGRSSRGGESSSWNRNTLNGFDPQGHVYFCSRAPQVRVDAISFGRTLKGITPWTVYLRSTAKKVVGTRIRLGCSARRKNIEFKGLRLEAGEANKAIAWLPYGLGINNLEARVSGLDRTPIYRCKLATLVKESDGSEVLDSSGGYARVRLSKQLLKPGDELTLNLYSEAGLLNQPPFGSDGLLVYVLPGTGGTAIKPELLQTGTGAAAKLQLKLPADLPEGFARVIVIPRSRLKTDRDRQLFVSGVATTAAALFNAQRHSQLVLSARLYVEGKKLEASRSFIAAARKTFEKTDGMSCEDAKKLHWGSAPPGYPEKRDANEFTSLFGGKYNVLKAEGLLKKAGRNCSVLENLPLYEADLESRLREMAAGRRPSRGILWKCYKSRFDGAWQPYSLYVPEKYDPKKKWPLIIDLHGYSGGWNLYPDQDKVQAARSAGCLLLKPYLRGMTWYMAWGEREMIDLLAAVRAEYNVDADRIHVTGFSMGGCGTMKFLASYPDVFASGGGSSGRAEPMGAERTALTPSWTADGFKDQGTPWTGGRMFALRAAEVEPVAARHRGDAFTGHGYIIDRLSLYSWLLAHPLNRWPRRVRFNAWSARFASLRWVKSVEPERYGRITRVTAEVRNERIELLTRNAAGARLSVPQKLLPAKEPIRVLWNGKAHQFPAGTRDVRLGTLAQEIPSGRKRPNELAGPIEDFLIRKFVMIRGTLRKPAEIRKGARWLRERWQHAYQAKPAIYEDINAPANVLSENHLLCVGDEETNSFLKKHAAKLPIRIDGDKLRIGRRTTPADGAKYWFLALNPLNPKKYMLVMGSQNPADTARALRPLISKPFRHFDFAVYGRRTARPRSERTARFAKLMGISAFGWFDRDWKPYPRDPLLPDCEFMDNQNPSLVLTPDGEWREGSEPEKRRARD